MFILYHMKRPIGVSIIAGFFLVSGPLEIYFILGMLYSQTFFESSVWQSFGTDVILFNIAISIATTIAGYGLLKLKIWAWWGTVALFIVSTALNGAGVMKYTGLGVLIDPQIISVVLGLGCIYYLVRVKISFDNVALPVKN